MMKAITLVTSLALLAPLTACTDRQMYETMQASRRNDCQKYDDETRARCLEGANMSYKQYRLERDKVPVNTQ
jgi:hypothetical protein